MTVEHDIALNELVDGYHTFLNEFTADMPDYTIARHIVYELQNKSYDDLTDLAHCFMQQFTGEQWAHLLYEFFHSEGLHRTKLDDLLEIYWDYMDEQEQGQEQGQIQEQGQESIPVG